MANLAIPPRRPARRLLPALLAALLLSFALPEAASAYRAQAVKLVEAGQKLLEMKRSAEAAQKFAEAVDEDPTYAPSYFHLAGIARDQGNLEEARLHIDKALKNSPHEGDYKMFLCDLNVQLASAALKDGNPQEALALYERNRTLVDFHLPTMNRLAGYHVSKENFDEAKGISNEALRKLQSSARRYPDAEVAVLHANLSICYFKTQDYTRAMSEIKMAAGKKPDLDIVKRYQKIIHSDENPVVSNMTKGDLAYDAKRFDEALASYKEVLKHYPTYGPAIEKKNAIENRAKIDELHAVADELMQKENFKEAEAAFNQILAYDAADARAKGGLAEIEKRRETKEKQEMFAGATAARDKGETQEEKAQKLAALAKLHAKERDPEEELKQEYEIAKGLFEDRKYDEALEKFLALRDKRPGYLDTTQIIGAIHRERGEIYFESFDRAFPRWYFYVFGALVVLAIIWRFVGEQVAEAMRPDSTKFFRNAVEYMENGKYKAALRQLAKAEKYAHGPQDMIKIREKIVSCHFGMKNHQEAIRIGKEILDRDPRNEKMITIVGEAYLDLNLTNEDALNIYRRMYRVKKEDSRLLNILCMAYVSDKNLSSEAVEVYEKAFIRNPGDKSIRSLLCEAYTRGNNRSEGAIRVYEASLADAPKMAEVRKMLIAAYFTRNKYEKTIQHCHALFAQGEFDEFAFDYLKNAYRKIGDTAAMQKAMEELLAKFPDEEVLKQTAQRARADLDVARLTGAAEAQAEEDAGGPRICGNCAHINPPKLSKCEKCATPIG